jgi:hypothetical protein
VRVWSDAVRSLLVRTGRHARTVPGARHVPLMENSRAAGAVFRFRRRLSHKPLNVPVHQLVVGHHPQNAVGIAGILGEQPSMRRGSGQLVPPLIAQRNFPALCNSLGQEQLRGVTAGWSSPMLVKGTACPLERSLPQRSRTSADA